MWRLLFSKRWGLGRREYFTFTALLSSYHMMSWGVLCSQLTIQLIVATIGLLVYLLWRKCLPSIFKKNINNFFLLKKNKHCLSWLCKLSYWEVLWLNKLSGGIPLGSFVDCKLFFPSYFCHFENSSLINYKYIVCECNHHYFKVSFSLLIIKGLHMTVYCFEQLTSTEILYSLNLPPPLGRVAYFLLPFP